MNEGSGLAENSTNSTVPCSPYARAEYAVIVPAISTASALVSALACAGVIALILLFKKHQFFTQRLVLYLNIIALTNAVSVTLHRVDYNGSNSATQGFCMFSGFLDQTTSWGLLIAVCCITVNLLLNVVFQKRTERLEKLYFVLIFVFPLTFNWIPFIKQAYGLAGAWCWIRSEEEDCSIFVFGVVLRFVLWYVPLYVILIILIVIYIVILYKIAKDRHKWEGKYDPNSQQRKEQMQKEVRPLIAYPLIYLLINMVPLINRIHNIASPEDPELTLWILSALLFPLTGGFMALAFTFDPQTLQRLKVSHIYAALQDCCNKRTVREYPMGDVKTDSFLRYETPYIDGSGGHEGKSNQDHKDQEQEA